LYGTERARPEALVEFVHLVRRLDRFDLLPHLPERLEPRGVGVLRRDRRLDGRLGLVLGRLRFVVGQRTVRVDVERRSLAGTESVVGIFDGFVGVPVR